MIHAAETSLGLPEPNYIQDWFRQRNGPGVQRQLPVVQRGHHLLLALGERAGGDLRRRLRADDRARGEVPRAGRVARRHRGDPARRHRVLDWGGSDVKSRIDHVGIVTGADAAGVYTIEGNYNDVCGRHFRYSNWIAGYGRPAYAGGSMGVRVGFVYVPGSVVLRHGATQPDHRGDARPADGGGLQRLPDTDRQGRLGTGDVRSYALWQHMCGFSGRSTPTGCRGTAGTGSRSRGPDDVSPIGGFLP